MTTNKRTAKIAKANVIRSNVQKRSRLMCCGIVNPPDEAIRYDEDIVVDWFAKTP